MLFFAGKGDRGGRICRLIVRFGKEFVGCGNMRNPTANNRESPRIAFFLFRPLDLRSRPYATPHRLRVVGTAERKMLENPRRGFSLRNCKSS